MNDAIAALYEAKSLMLESNINHPAETWCRLPLYLQHAGRYEEAMLEFDYLLADLPERAKRYSSLDDPSVGPASQKQKYHDLILRTDRKIIEEKRKLAMQRQAVEQSRG